MTTLLAKNITDSAITVKDITVYSIQKDEVEKVVVEDANHSLFNAFKYTFNNTPYYYIIDGVQTHWQNNIAQLGYREYRDLPTVNLENIAYVYSSGPETAELSNNASFYGRDGSGNDLLYDDLLVYAVYNWSNSQSSSGSYCAYFSVSNDIGKIKFTNISGTSLRTHHVLYATCSDLNTITITVYNSNDTAYNAFKYTTNNTDYYYVLDGIQTDWTDDLSSIGYHLPVVLPTVIISGYWGDNPYNWLQSIEGPESVPANSLSSVLSYRYVETEYVYPDYESKKKYGIIQWQQSGGTTSGRTEFEIVELNGKMCVKNVSSGTLTFYQAKVAICSDPTATVVTVYDSQNIGYNAFRFTAPGTDYYYVLDETQLDWTDDLSSIGYSLTPQVKVAYFNSSKTTQSLGMQAELDLYDANGNQIPSYIGTVYTTTGVFYGDGTEILQFKDGGGTLHPAKDCISPVNEGGILYAHKAYTVLYSENWATASAAYITYTES